MAMREMGYAEADVLKYSNLSAKDKKKLMIADNQVASLGVDDYGAIEEFLRSLDGDIDVPGYDEETLKMIISESESATEAAMSYGVYAVEEVSGLKEIERDRAENGFQPVAQSYAPSEPVMVAPSSPSPLHSAPAPAPDEFHGEQGGKVYAKTQETERFVICPHCGEKIYI